MKRGDLPELHELTPEEYAQERANYRAEQTSERPPSNGQS